MATIHTKDFKDFVHRHLIIEDRTTKSALFIAVNPSENTIVYTVFGPNQEVEEFTGPGAFPEAIVAYNKLQ